MRIAGPEVWRSFNAERESIELWIDGTVIDMRVYTREDTIEVVIPPGEGRLFRFNGLRTARGLRIFEEVTE